MNGGTLWNQDYRGVNRKAQSHGVDGYGGGGQITDVQQPRYGQQVMDVPLPF